MDDVALVAALARGDNDARARLIKRFGSYVKRLVGGSLRVDSDLPDVVQDVFVQVIERIHLLRDPDALSAWIATVAVFTARLHIRRQRSRRWLTVMSPDDIPDAPDPAFDPEGRALLRETHRVLDRLPDDERMAFCLRFMGEMQLVEVADACGVSLSTIKRRLTRAAIRFRREARQHPMLKERLERGRWRRKRKRTRRRSSNVSR